MNKTHAPYRLLIVILVAALAGIPVLQADHSDEEVTKKIQASDYSIVTGNWDVQVDGSTDSIAKEFKKHMPSLEYIMVEEKMDGDNYNMKFRGPGDTAVVLKLKPMGDMTNVRIRFGLTGDQMKSAELFSYVYKRM